MHCTHIKIFFQFLVGNITIQSSRKRFINVVINLCMIVTVNCRIQKNQEYDQPYFVVLCNKSGSFIHTWNQSFVFCLFNCSVKYKDHCRKDSNTTDNTNNYTFCHDDTHITSQRKGHNTQCKKSGNCCNRTSCYRFKGICDRMCHRTFFLIIFLLISFKGVQKENGIVHCYTKLKYCSQGFCNIAYMAKEDITSQVINNCKTYTEQKQYRNYQ